MGANSSIEWLGEGGITSRPLRCVRCGDRFQSFDPADPYLPHLCGGCFTKAIAALDDSSDAYFFFLARCYRNVERRPTVRAVAKWWAAELTSVPASQEPF